MNGGDGPTGYCADVSRLATGSCEFWSLQMLKNPSVKLCISAKESNDREQRTRAVNVETSPPYAIYAL